jgi:protein-tyrosine phosphatase
MRRIAGYSLWLGHVDDAVDVTGLHANGISAVVDLAGNELPIVLPREVTYCRFPLIDGPGNPIWLLRAAIDTVAHLARNGVATLVYCSAGLSRSPCIAAAALAQIRHCTVAEALPLVIESRRCDVSPGLLSDMQRALTIDSHSTPHPG